MIKFENGMMIKLRLPDCQLDEFEKLFDLIFEYLEIDHYLVLNDLVDGGNLIKSTFKELKFLETYNPLINLIWNDKDKKWRNHKLFNENFEPVYPDLFFGEKTILSCIFSQWEHGLKFKFTHFYLTFYLVPARKSCVFVQTLFNQNHLSSEICNLGLMRQILGTIVFTS